MSPERLLYLVDVDVDRLSLFSAQFHTGFLLGDGLHLPVPSGSLLLTSTEDDPKDQRVGDFASFGSTAFAVNVNSLRKAPVVEAALRASCSLVPVVTDAGEPFVALRVKLHSRGLNESKSAIKRFDDGTVMWIDSAVFDHVEWSDPVLFRTVQAPRGAVFATPAFKKLIEDSGLDGLTWVPSPVLAAPA